MMRRQRGFTLIELVVMAAILAIIITAVTPILQDMQSTSEASIAAQQLKEVARASAQYIKSNYTTLQGIATATTAAAVNTAAMQAQGLLPAAGVYRNPWRQTYTLYVLEPTPNNLVGLVLTAGGKGAPVSATNPEDIRFAEQVVPAAARRAGAMGGFVSTGNIAGSVGGRVYGAAGGWQMSLSGTNIPNPGPGHLAAMLYLEQGQLVEDYLYRVAVPGNPDANRMHVTLDMNNNDIANVDNIEADSIDITDYDGLQLGGQNVANGLIGWMGLVSNFQQVIPRTNDVNNEVNCPTPGGRWVYAAIPTNVVPVNTVEPIGGWRVRLRANSGWTHYRTEIHVAVSGGWVNAAADAQAWVFIFCGNGA